MIVFDFFLWQSLQGQELSIPVITVKGGNHRRQLNKNGRVLALCYSSLYVCSKLLHLKSVVKSLLLFFMQLTGILSKEFYARLLNIYCKSS